MNRDLWSVDLEIGARMVEILDRAGIEVRVAMWALLSEYEDWRLVFSSPRFDFPDPRTGYGLLHESASAAGMPHRLYPPVLILRSDDRFIRGLLRTYGKRNSVDGTRVRYLDVGRRFVEDSFVYRIR